MGGQADTCYIITKALSVKYLAKRMDGFPSSSPALQRGKGGGDINKEQLMEEVKAQIAVQNVQALLRQMSNKCFNKCITSPGSSLGSSESKCVAMCMDRYMDAWNIVSKAYASRLQKELSGGGMQH